MRDKFLKAMPLCFAGAVLGIMFVAGIGATGDRNSAVMFNTVTHQSSEYCDFIGNGIKFNGQLPVVQSQLQSYQVSLGYTAENAANKSNDVVADYNSSTKYSTTGSIWTWVKSLLSINEISSVGSGASLYSDRLGDTVRLKSLVQGANIAINSYSDHIEIDTFEFSNTFTSSNSTGFAWTDNNLAITHNLSKKLVNVIISDGSDNKINYAITFTSINIVTITFPVAQIPISGTYLIRIF